MLPRLSEPLPLCCLCPFPLRNSVLTRLEVQNRPLHSPPWQGDPPQVSRCVLGGGGCHGFVKYRSPRRLPHSSTEGETEARERGCRSPSEFNSSLPVSTSWVVPSPRSRREGEAVPGAKPGRRLPTHRPTPSGLCRKDPVPCPLLERAREARRAPPRHDPRPDPPQKRPPETPAPSPRPRVRPAAARSPSREPHSRGLEVTVTRAARSSEGLREAGASGNEGSRGRSGDPRNLRDPSPGPGKGRAPAPRPAGSPRAATLLRRVQWGRGPSGHAARARAPTPPPRAASRPYPRHNSQNGVRLPDQGVGVEGAPGFAGSVRTPFHRGCTRAAPPARRAPPSRARARRPRPLPCSGG